jgi:hypothetical protein
MRPCGICVSAEKMRIAGEMIAKNCSDQAIADACQVGRMVSSRHRRFHVLEPARAVVAAASKGADAVTRRQEIMAAVEEGNSPQVWLALSEIVKDLRGIHDRLERSAAGAEADGQRMAVASLSSQQIKAQEVRAKMGGIGGYAPQRDQGGGAGGTRVNISINLGDDRVEKFTTVVGGDRRGEVIDNDALGPLPS